MFFGFGKKPFYVREKEYVNKLDAIRGVNAKDVFPELAHLL